jgi:thiamine-phosphate diphosphorylase
VRSLEEARASVREGADYVGFGPVYETRTKRMTVAAKGPALLSEVARGAGVPVVAIGGINLERAEEVSRAGAAAAAVVSEILCSADPIASARGFVEAFRRAT